jgi:hypothetical protein
MKSKLRNGQGLGLGLVSKLVEKILLTLPSTLDEEAEPATEGIAVAAKRVDF